MKLDWRSLASLKVSVIVAFIVLWNGGLFLASYLGGAGLAITTPVGFAVSGAVFLGASAFFILVARLKRIQEVVVAPERAANFNPKEFYFAALVAGLLAVGHLAISISGGAFVDAAQR